MITERFKRIFSDRDRLIACEVLHINGKISVIMAATTHPSQSLEISPKDKLGWFDKIAVPDDSFLPPEHE